ncbi:MAG TPA: prolipoprotein diacylglyceryl transferase [Dehalococcoidales bacterium]|nr:prolipoprotein diacylglyceryl transferase [Dehalococcoidales bacterium]
MRSVFYLDIDPIIFEIGPLVVGWYGLMVALAVITVVAWVIWQNSQRRIISYDAVFMAAVVGIPSGIFFSKILHVISAWSYYVEHPAQIFSQQGLTIWGAVLGAALGIWIYSKVSRKFRFPLFGDLIAPGIILSQAIGRVGCTIAGCCYGIESRSPIAVIYNHPESFAPNGIPVLPTQVFEIIYNLIIFIVLVCLRGRFTKEGTIFYLYLFLYAAWRFGSDFLREGSPLIFGLHDAQVIGLVVMLVTLPLIVYKNGWVKRSAGPSPDSAN